MNAKKTVVGGLIFVLIFCILSFLVVSELNAFFFGKPIVEPFIAANDHERVRVNLNITMYQLPCNVISLDYADITGSHFEDIS